MPLRNLIVIALTSAIVMGVTGALLSANPVNGLAMGAGALTTAALLGMLSHLNTDHRNRTSSPLPSEEEPAAQPEGCDS